MLNRIGKYIERRLNGRAQADESGVLISLHIPKTAGATFREVLLQVYGPQKIFFDYEEMPLDPLSDYHADNDAWMKRNGERVVLNEEIQVFHGHFPVMKYVGTVPRGKIITWIRDPVARLLSHYDYWKRTPPDAHSLHRQVYEQDMSIVEFAALPVMRNCMSRIFMKGVDLDRFYFIGLQEHFDEDLKELAGLLQWPSYRAGRINVNPRSSISGREMNESLVQHLMDLNNEDVALYEKVLALRRDRVRNRRS